MDARLGICTFIAREPPHCKDPAVGREGGKRERVTAPTHVIQFHPRTASLQFYLKVLLVLQANELPFLLRTKISLQDPQDKITACINPNPGDP